MTFAFDKPADVSGRFYLHGLESRLSVAAGGDEVEIVLCPARPAQCPQRAGRRHRLPRGRGLRWHAVQAGLSAFRGLKGRCNGALH
jgi:hypothetical protein